VTITPRAPLSVTLAGTVGTGNANKTVTFTATVKPDVGGADVAQSFDWDFDFDGSFVADATTSGNTTAHIYNTGPHTAAVRVTTTDGRTATAQTEINVP